MKSYTSRKAKKTPSIPSNSCGLESPPGQDAEGTYKTYLGGGALPPDGFTNPADPRVQEELTDHFCWRPFDATYQTLRTNTHTRCLPSSLGWVFPLN